MDLVISYYKEDIDWMSEIHRQSVYFYNKTPDIIIPPTYCQHYSFLPNIGRESQTYLHHIITNYQTLSEWTIFSQANPFDHCPYFLNAINQENLDGMRQVVLRNNQYNKLVFEDYIGFGIHWDYRYNERLDDGFPPRWQCIELVCNYMGIPYTGQTWTCGYGAIFAVHRNRIWSRTLDFYKGLCDLHQEHFGMPWAMEVLWSWVLHTPAILL